MKKQLIALVGLGLLLATASASAQTVPLKANIPFNFIVNKSELPAGEYTLKSLGSSDTVMVIESEDGRRQDDFAEHLHSPKRQRQQARFPPLRRSDTSSPRSGRRATSRARNCQKSPARD